MVVNIQICASFYWLAFISPTFLQITKQFAQSCDCMISAFRNSDTGDHQPLEVCASLPFLYYKILHTGRYNENYKKAYTICVKFTVTNVKPNKKGIQRLNTRISSLNTIQLETRNKYQVSLYVTEYLCFAASALWSKSSICTKNLLLRNLAAFTNTWQGRQEEMCQSYLFLSGSYSQVLFT